MFLHNTLLCVMLLANSMIHALTVITIGCYPNDPKEIIQNKSHQGKF